MPLAPDDLHSLSLSLFLHLGRAADAFEIVLADGRKMGMKVRRWDGWLGQMIVGLRMGEKGLLLHYRIG